MRAAIILLGLTVTAQAQTTWHVDDDACPGPGTGSAGDPFCSIQVAIDASADGDTVLVAAGVYVENINFNGKNVRLVSEEGPASTEINGAGLAAVITLENGEGPAARIEGFTITNGFGAGVFLIGSSPTVRGNTISDNTGGSGIHCRDGSDALIEGNMITGNSNPNVAAHQGGAGVSMRASAPTIAGNLIANNTVVSVGGGILCYYRSEPLIINNTIINNTATSPTTGHGGGVACRHGSAIATLVNNTIYGNTAAGGGGGLYTGLSGTLHARNTIIWSNGPDAVLDTGVSVLTYCDVEGGWPGTGNIDTDPMFASPGTGDFALLPGSPCIDAGDPNDPLDCDWSRVDMGVLLLSCGDPGLPSCFGVACPCGNDDPAAGCANSTGSGGLLTGQGTRSIIVDNLELIATQLPPNNNGLFYMGDVQVAAPLYDGWQCTLGTTFRFLDAIQNSGPLGQMSLGTGIVADSGGLIDPGETWHFHCWFRDVPVAPPACGTGANLTNLYSVTFVP